MLKEFTITRRPLVKAGSCVSSIESIDVFKLQSGGLPVFVFPLRESWMIFVMAVDVSTYK